MNKRYFDPYHKGKPTFFLDDGKSSCLEEAIWVVNHMKVTGDTPYGTKLTKEDIKILMELIESDEYRTFLILRG